MIKDKMYRCCFRIVMQDSLLRDAQSPPPWPPLDSAAAPTELASVTTQPYAAGLAPVPVEQQQPEVEATLKQPEVATPQKKPEESEVAATVEQQQSAPVEQPKVPGSVEQNDLQVAASVDQNQPQVAAVVEKQQPEALEQQLQVAGSMEQQQPAPPVQQPQVTAPVQQPQVATPVEKPQVAAPVQQPQVATPVEKPQVAAPVAVGQKQPQVPEQPQVPTSVDQQQPAAAGLEQKQPEATPGQKTGDEVAAQALKDQAAAPSTADPPQEKLQVPAPDLAAKPLKAPEKAAFTPLPGGPPDRTLELAGINALMQQQKQREAQVQSEAEINAILAGRAVHITAPRVDVSGVNWSSHKKEGMRLKRLMEESADGKNFPHMTQMWQGSMAEPWQQLGISFFFLVHFSKTKNAWIFENKQHSGQKEVAAAVGGLQRWPGQDRSRPGAFQVTVQETRGDQGIVDDQWDGSSWYPFGENPSHSGQRQWRTGQWLSGTCKLDALLDFNKCQTSWHRWNAAGKPCACSSWSCSGHQPGLFSIGPTAGECCASWSWPNASHASELGCISPGVNPGFRTIYGPTMFSSYDV